MPVVQQGQINTTALIVPDLYVQIVPPSVALLNGVPTNILGFVGTAQWGPVNSPVVLGSMADYARNFGAIMPRKYDMGTAVAAAVLQGAANMRGVRITDGTDVAASATIAAAPASATGTLTFSANPSANQTIVLNGTTITFVASGATGPQVNIGANLAATLANLQTLLAAGSVIPTATMTSSVSPTVLTLTAGSNYPGNAGNALTITAGTSGATVSGGTLTGGAAAVTGMTVTAKYTGTLGNSLQVTMSAGSAANTSRVTLSLPGQTPEVFDNVAGAGNALWVNLAAAINNGVSVARGASALAVASAGAAVTGIAASTTTLSGGTDGATTINGAALVGVDGITRTGMYALRGTGTSIGVLVDCDDYTTSSNQVAYGLSEGTYMIGVGPAGETPTNAAAAKATAGIDSYAFKQLLGDWVYFLDTVNNLTRIISPQGFVAGLLSNLSPEQSSLNKQLYGVVATQRSFQSRPYSTAELTILGQAGIDVITNPVPGGSYFGARFGHNSSSNAVTNTDNYTRMTNYIAYTLNAGMGKYVGMLQSTRSDDPTRAKAKATVDSFMAGMFQQNQIAAWSTICDLTNNLPARIATGYMQMDVKVQYLSVVEKFLVNLEGGQSVQVARTSTVAQN